MPWIWKREYSQLQNFIDFFDMNHANILEIYLLRYYFLGTNQKELLYLQISRKLEISSQTNSGHFTSPNISSIFQKYI
jgi:hypothetical protein